MIIMLSGYKGSGKDTAADYIISKNKNIKRIAFAKVLKEMVADTFSIPVEFTHDRVLKEASLEEYPVLGLDLFSMHIHELLKSELKSGYWTPRALCILLGSIMRSVDGNYWVNRAIKDHKAGDISIITDFRYKSEYLNVLNYANSIGEEVVTIRVNRFDTVDTQDPSERDLDNFYFNYAIHNVGTKEEFYNKIDNLIELLSI